MSDFGISGDLTLFLNLQRIQKELAAVGKDLQTQMGKSAAAAGTAVEKGLNKPLKESHVAASKTYGYMKDIGRIVQGIFISQILYRAILQPLQQAVKALWQFNMELERTELAFKYLLRDVNDVMANTVELAKELIKDLKIIAAQTPYTMKTVTDAATTLLALGFEQTELRSLLIIMADLSAATGGEADQMEKLAWALGRVEQQGKLTRRELRLFVTARVPIMKILEEQLGITEWPAKFSIPAAIAMPAILQGIMKFKGAAAEMEMTMSGLLSSIHDYFLFIARDIFAGFFDSIKERLTSLRARLAELWEVFGQFGLEGLIANIFPPDIALSIWQLIHLLQELGRTIGTALQATAPFRQELMNMALIILNWVNTAFLILGNILGSLIGTVSKVTIITRIFAAALIGLTVARTIAISLTLLAKAFGSVSVAATVAFGRIGLVVGVLAAIALMIPKVRQWLANLGNTFLKMFGIQIPQSMATAQDAIKDVNSDINNIDWQKFIDGFSDETEAVTEDLKDVKDQVDDTKKAIDKYLLSFDEVYAIPEKTDKIIMPAIEEVIPEIPVFEPLMVDFPIEDAIEDIEDALEEFEDTSFDLLEWLKTFFTDLWKIIKKFGILIRDQFRNVLQFVKDVVGATGTLVKESWRNVKYLGQVIGYFFKTLWGALTQLVKELWGAVTEFAKGMWGAFSQIFKDIWNAVKEFVTGIWDAITQLVKTLWDALLTFIKGFWDAIKELWKSLFSAESFSDAIEAIKTFFSFIKELFTEWFSTVREAFGTFFTNITEAFSTFFTSIKEAFSNFFMAVKEAFSNLFTNIIEAFGNFFNNVRKAWSTLLEGIHAFITIAIGSWKKFLNSIFEAVVDFVNNSILNISRFFTDSEEQAQYYAKKYQKMFWDMVKNLTAPIREAIDRVMQFLSSLGDRIKAKFISVLLSIKNTISSVISMAANAINRLIELINKIPGVNIPSIKTSGITGGIGVGVTPGMAAGGILGREQIVRAAENNVPEAYTPLTAQAIKPWAEAIVMAMGTERTGSQPVQDIGYVAVPIDNKGMVDLERQLFVVRKRENIRRSIGVTV